MERATYQNRAIFIGDNAGRSPFDLYTNALAALALAGYSAHYADQLSDQLAASYSAGDTKDLLRILWNAATWAGVEPESLLSDDVELVEPEFCPSILADEMSDDDHSVTEFWQPEPLFVTRMAGDCGPLTLEEYLSDPCVCELSLLEND